MQQLDAFLEFQNHVVSLCKMMARPPVIRDLVPKSILTSTIYATYRHVNNAPPPQGQFPREIATLLSTPRKRLQTSVLLCIWERMSELTDISADRYIKTYEIYRESCFDGGVDFNRAWFTIRQFTQRRIALRNCTRCGQRHAYNREDASDVRRCPVCVLMASEKKKPGRVEAPEVLLEGGECPDYSFMPRVAHG